MSRFVPSGLVVALACASTACKSSETSSPPPPATRDFAGEEKIRFRSEPEETGARSDSDPSAISYVLCPFENVVYLPWKFVGGGVKGAADGVSAGFGKDRMAFFGALFSPVNAVLGLVTGAFEGLAVSPGLVGPGEDFGRAMGAPVRHPTTIWWYKQ